MGKNDRVVDIREEALDVGLEEEADYAEMLISRGVRGERAAQIMCAFLACKPLECGHIECKKSQLESVRFVLHGSPYKTARNVN